MKNEIYWLWLQQCVGYAKDITVALEYFQTAKAIYQADDKERKQVFSSIVCKKMRETDLSKAEELFNFCTEHSIHIITPDSEFYPKKLLSIKDYPLVLYVRGDKTCLNKDFSLAVIGSRTPSAYGEEVATDIVAALTQKDVLIVSGGALGIDSVAHTACLEQGGKTVLVMGCGHGTPYLSENSALRKRVAYHGALVSEYPPYYPVGKGTFPQRNRIISGMSDGLAIIEAAERSGTFSTANHAKRQGRKLFVLPGDVKSGNFAGSNRLITEGATPVFSGRDIISAYGMTLPKENIREDKTGTPFQNIEVPGAFSQKRKRSSAKKTKNQKVTEKAQDKNQEKDEKNLQISKNPPEGVSKNAEIVYNVMSEGVCELDMITKESQLEIRHVLVALTELEMSGAVSMDGPNTYKIK